MSYLNAPATRMLATHCVLCHTPLLDAKSVELGIGPDCRSRRTGARAARDSGYADMATISEDARIRANKVIYTVACDRTPANVAAAVTELALLGLARLAGVLADRNAAVKVTLKDGRYSVATGYSEVVVAAMRAIPGRQWDKKAKVNTFPASSRAALWTMIQRQFRGLMGVGPQGVFLIGPAAKPAPTPAQIEADEEAREARKEGMLASDHEPDGCPGCGDADFHDGEPCPHTHGAWS